MSAEMTTSAEPRLLPSTFGQQAPRCCFQLFWVRILTKNLCLRDLKKSGVECIRSLSHHPTTNKNAIVAGGYRLLKVDTLDNRSISDDIVAGADAIYLSDALRRRGIQ